MDKQPKILKKLLLEFLTVVFDQQKKSPDTLYMVGIVGGGGGVYG